MFRNSESKYPAQSVQARLFSGVSRYWWMPEDGWKALLADTGSYIISWGFFFPKKKIGLLAPLSKWVNLCSFIAYLPSLLLGPVPRQTVAAAYVLFSFQTAFLSDPAGSLWKKKISTAWGQSAPCLAPGWTSLSLLVDTGRENRHYGDFGASYVGLGFGRMGCSIQTAVFLEGLSVWLLTM